jgi:two-component system, sensor histidine kinase
VDLLGTSGIDETQQRYVRLAREAGQSLLSVINDILDFSKIEAEKVELEKAEFNLHRLVEDITELLTPIAITKNLMLACFIQPNVPQHVIGDSNRIRQVLTNLINNGLKFTSIGGVNVRISLDRTVETSAVVRVRVEDSGIGIPADRVDRLFKVFSQVDSSTSRRFGGTGLGLVISKRLVELMNGEIGIESKEGRGSVFWFTLELDLPAFSVKALPGLVGAGGLSNADLLDASRGLHLLVADDNEMNQFVTQEMLRKCGCTCDIAVDGKQAVEMARSGRYDAVLMDCQMPEMDGLEATREIRRLEASEPGSPRLPVIALTAEASDADRALCLGAGMDGYLSKPIDGVALQGTLGRLAKKPRAVQLLPAAGAIEAEDSPGRSLRHDALAGTETER